jgi:hypothetical protein
MNTLPSWSTTDAAVEATIGLRERGYPHVTVRVRNLLNIEGHGVGPWRRDVNGRRRLTNRDIDELVRYFVGHLEAQGRYPIDNTPTTDPEDRA